MSIALRGYDAAMDIYIGRLKIASEQKVNSRFLQSPLSKHLLQKTTDTIFYRMTSKNIFIFFYNGREGNNRVTHGK